MRQFDSCIVLTFVSMFSYMEVAFVSCFRYRLMLLCYAVTMLHVHLLLADNFQPVY